MRGGVEVGAGGERVLVLLPGFVIPARSYTGLVSSLVGLDPGLRVVVPQLYRIGPGVLTGRYSVAQEARAAADLVAGLARSGVPGWLAGHSRGGQVAWLAAEILEESARPAGLVLIDPVDNTGPRSPTGRPPRFSLDPLVIGAGIGSRCAPAGRNHQRFATAAPRRIHATVHGCGHADVLTGGALRWGRMLCPGGPDPQRARATVTALIAAHLRGELQPHLVAAGPERGTPSLGRDDQWPTTVVWD
ncbi:MAG TPA: alpha/beta fold hydrolase [Candidatus Limnocylindrales bacterium]|nr:alpha/beta fold hydrolase [Candidatus Limnocylindrales bacterium]